MRRKTLFRRTRRSSMIKTLNEHNVPNVSKLRSSPPPLRSTIRACDVLAKICKMKRCDRARARECIFARAHMYIRSKLNFLGARRCVAARGGRRARSTRLPEREGKRKTLRRRSRNPRAIRSNHPPRRSE